MTADDIRRLPLYAIPDGWIVHLIDRRTHAEQLQVNLLRDTYEESLLHSLGNPTIHRPCPYHGIRYRFALFNFDRS